ncbi:MAG: ABC transporter ATP-binding protein [Gallionella sp.]|nr:ABC transporter ATP-binding protein [Gallionella sp.]
MTHRDISTFRKIWDILTHTERNQALVLLVLMLIGMILETLGVSLVIPAITLLIQDNLAARYPVIGPVLVALGNPDQQTLIIGGMLTLVAVYFIKALFIAFLAWRQTRFAFGIQAQLSQRLFTTYLRQPYTFHLQRNSAQLIRNAVNEVSVFSSDAILPGMLIITECMVMLGIGSLLLLIEPLGTLIVGLVLGAVAWAFHRVMRAKVTLWGKARLYHDGMRIQHLQHGLGGAKDVKLLGRESDFLAQYSVHNTQSAQMGQLQGTLLQLPRLWLEFFAVAGMTLLVLSMLAQGRDITSIVPTLGLFALASFRLMPSVSRVLSSAMSMRYGLAVVGVLHDELKLNVPETAAKDTNGTAFQHEIRLTDLSYAYPDAAESTLSNLSIVINKGEFIGFIGSSGAGKSTLVDIILGLLAPSAGQVRVDGQDISQNLRHWQDQIGYVPQSIYLTDDTLKRNVAFGLPNEQIDTAAVWRAIQAAQLEDFVASLPDGLETIVGERGIRLSGGQRQRIGIARALYHEPSVLVLDEATSALDTNTEQGVMDAVTVLRKNKTIIVVAHRLSTVEHCDRLYRLERGKVAEEIMPT